MPNCLLLKCQVYLNEIRLLRILIIVSEYHGDAGIHVSTV